MAAPGIEAHYRESGDERDANRGVIDALIRAVLEIVPAARTVAPFEHI